MLPGGQVLGHKSMADCRAVQVPLQQDHKCSLSSFPSEGKLLLILWCNVDGEKGICQVCDVMLPPHCQRQVVHEVHYGGEGGKQEQRHLVQFPVVHSHAPSAIQLADRPHRGIE